jgi:hypothetical protein
MRLCPFCPAFIAAEQGTAERDDVCAAIPDTETFSTCQRKICGIPTCSGNAASGRAKGAVPFTAELVVSTALIAGRITTMQRTRSTLTMLINRVTLMMRTRNLYSELD